MLRIKELSVSKLKLQTEGSYVWTTMIPVYMWTKEKKKKKKVLAHDNVIQHVKPMFTN